MKNILSTTVLAASLTFCGFANAGTHIEEVFDCTVKDGKTMADVNAANANWIKFVNKKVKGGGINSRAVTPLVGDFGGFVVVDSFPDLTSWVAMKAAMETKDGLKVGGAVLDTVDCSSSRLYSSTN